MRSWFYISLLIVGVCSCKTDRSEAPQQVIEISDQLSGDWVTVLVDTSGIKHVLYLSVDDSMITVFSRLMDQSRYTIRDSVVTVFCDSTSYLIKSDQEFKIDRVDSSNLQLTMLTTDIKDQLTRNGYAVVNPVKFTRIEEKNDLSPSVIGFSSSVCFGTCPSMILEIDQDRNMKFYGGAFSKKEGGYTATVPIELYKIITRQIRSLPIDSLKREYVAPWTDDQTCYLYIETPDTSIAIKSYGRYQTPLELSLVFNRLMSLYTRLDLVKDSTINNHTSFNPDFKHSIVVTIPPPPSEE